MARQISAEAAAASAIASVELAGLTVTAEDRELLRRVIAGELTADEAMKQVIQESKYPTEQPT